jgi:hypothetical protein
VDANIERLTIDERSLAKTHIEGLGGMGTDFGGRKPVIICDRGYPSKDFIKYLQGREIKYVMRVRKKSKNISPERFLQKADTDTVFFLFPQNL